MLIVTTIDFDIAKKFSKYTGLCSRRACSEFPGLASHGDEGRESAIPRLRPQSATCSSGW
jgi:hypothetical protein